MEMSKELGTMWKALSEANKQPYKACPPPQLPCFKCGHDSLTIC